MTGTAGLWRRHRHLVGASAAAAGSATVTFLTAIRLAGLWPTLLVTVGVAALCTGSLVLYWKLTSALGRATTLAALSLGWAAVLVGLALASPQARGTTDVAAYGLSGVIGPWLVAALTVPVAAAGRGARRAGRRLAGILAGHHTDTRRPTPRRTRRRR